MAPDPEPVPADSAQPDADLGTYVFQPGATTNASGTYVYRPPIPAWMARSSAAPRSFVPRHNLRPARIFAMSMVGLLMLGSVWRLLDLARVLILLGRVENGADVSIDKAKDLDISLTGASDFARFSGALAAAAVVVWFWQVRRNAGDLGPGQQRHLQEWAAFGWICPVVNFWIPYQIAVDAFTVAQPDGSRSTPALIRTWWGLFVAAEMLKFWPNPTVLERATGLADLRAYLEWEIVSTVAVLVAAVATILVVRQLTALLDKRRFQDAARVTR